MLGTSGGIRINHRMEVAGQRCGTHPGSSRGRGRHRRIGVGYQLSNDEYMKFFTVKVRQLKQGIDLPIWLPNLFYGQSVL